MSDKPLLSTRMKATIATTLVTTLITVIAGGWLKHWFVPPDPAPVPAQAVTAGELLASSPISFAEWQLLVERPRSALNSGQIRSFHKHQVVWEGFLEHVNRHDNGDAARIYSLIMVDRPTALNSHAILPPPSVRCFFNVNAGPQLESLQTGDWLVVQGKINDATMLGSKLGTDLEQCQIVATHEKRDVTVAALSETSPRRR